MGLLNDLMYVERLGFQLEGFKKLNDNLWNFRCPLCGDSKKNPRKKRGHIFPNKDRSCLMFKCHKCGVSHSFSTLLKLLDKKLFQEYLALSFGKAKSALDHLPARAEEIKPTKAKVAGKANICAINLLPDGHVVKEYLEKRMIPHEKWSRLAYTGKFHQLAKSLDPDYNFPDRLLNIDAPALILPFMDHEGFFGFQGRFLDPEAKMRYITVLHDKAKERTFGLDKCDKSVPFFVLEGPIDSLFLQNAIAVCGSDMGRISEKTAIFVPDNEPRNKHIVKKVEKLINEGRKVVLLPSEFNGSDINDMVLSGLDLDEIEEILNNFTYSGLPAVVRFNQWRKI